MFIMPYWFSLRKNIIISFLFDIFAFVVFFNTLKVYSNGFKTIFFNFFILFFWLLTSYVVGRYHQNKKDILENIKNIFLSCLNFFVYFSFTFLLFYKIIDFKDNYIYWENFVFFVKYIIASFIGQYFLRLFLISNSKSQQNWEFVGSHNSFLKLLDLVKISKININYSDSIDKLLTDNKKVRNIIIEKFGDFTSLNQEKIINLYFQGENIFSIVNWSEIFLQRIPSVFLSSNELLNLFANISRGRSFQIRLKRISDIFLSLIMLIFALPIMCFFGILILLEDNGPILYFQDRVGKNGIKFRICKLRTMKVNAEEGGAQWSKKNDVRITQIGKFLRASRIDELPQLYSVLIGNMSLIGPRPERPEIDSNLKKIIPFYDLRYLVKPGLSGWAQVNYSYGSSIDDSEIKLTYDFFYIKNFSFWLDLLIFFRTIRLVSRREGANPIR